MGQDECLLAELLVKIFSVCVLMPLSVMIYGMVEKDCSFSLVDPENLVRTAGAVIQTDFTHCPGTPCYVHCYELPECTAAPPLSGKGHRTGLQATSKEGFPLPWATV